VTRAFGAFFMSGLGFRRCAWSPSSLKLAGENCSTETCTSFASDFRRRALERGGGQETHVVLTGSSNLNSIP
jgi:hypothetical protein